MIFSVISSIVFLLFIVYYLFLKPRHEFWKKRGVIGPTPSVIVGNLLESITMKKSLGQLYASIYHSYTDLSYVGIYKFYSPTILLRDPDVIKDVLIKEFNKFHDNAIEMDEEISSLFSKNPFILKGEKWKSIRSKLTPCFTSGKIKSVVPLLHESGEKMVNYVKRELQTDPKNVFDGKELAAKFTTENIASCAFGTNGKCFEDPKAEFREIGRRMFETSWWQGLQMMVLLLWPTLARFLHLKFVPSELEDRFKKIIKQIMTYRAENKVVRNDFLDIMKELKELKYGKEAFTDDDVAGQCAGFFLDGFETSSTALNFIIFDLANNPWAQVRLKEEIDSTFTKYNNQITYEAIQEMIFLDSVCSESLRLHPPALNLERKCTEKYILKPQINGCADVTVDVGTTLVIPVYGLHFDSKHFSNPTTFDPDRFSPENKSSITKCSYLPFGDGPRVCLGQRFALSQIKIGLIHLVKNFEIKLNEKTKTPLVYDPRNFLLEAEGGLWFNFIPRI